MVHCGWETSTTSEPHITLMATSTESADRIGYEGCVALIWNWKLVRTVASISSFHFKTYESYIGGTVRI